MVAVGDRQHPSRCSDRDAYNRFIEPLVGAAKTAIQTSDGFLRSLLGPAFESAGALLGERINEYRHRKLVDTLNRAQSYLKKAGVSPRQVPLKIIHPLLEAATREVDPDLQARWVQLLTTTADPRAQDAHPSFVSILSQLTAAEAKLIEAICSSASNIAVRHYSDDETATSIRIDPTDGLARIFETAGLARSSARMMHSLNVPEAERDSVAADHAALGFAVDNLTRLGLLERRRDFELEIVQNYSARFEKEPPPLQKSDIRSKKEVGLYLTQLGRAFVRACSPQGDS
jgi:hypothetical protein